VAEAHLAELERAARRDDDPRAWIRLARALERVHDEPAAWLAYWRAGEAPPAELTAAVSARQLPAAEAFCASHHGLGYATVSPDDFRVESLSEPKWYTTTYEPKVPVVAARVHLGDDAALLERIPQLETLLVLTLRGGVRSPERLASLSALRHLCFLATPLLAGDYGWLRGLPDLRALSLRGDGEELAEAAPTWLGSFAHLDARLDLLLGEEPCDLEPLRGLGIRQLRVSGKPFTHSAPFSVPMGEAIGAAASLAVLDLGNTLIRRGALAPLGRLPALRCLRLTADDADAHLQELEPLARLERLELRCRTLSDAGLESLSKLRGLQGLHVDVRYRTQVSSAGVAHLSALKGLRQLHYTGIPEAAEGRLREVAAAVGARITRLVNREHQEFYADKYDHPDIKGPF
jgi:hypothetical protein